MALIGKSTCRCDIGQIHGLVTNKPARMLHAQPAHIVTDRDALVKAKTACKRGRMDAYALGQCFQRKPLGESLAQRAFHCGDPGALRPIAVDQAQCNAEHLRDDRVCFQRIYFVVYELV